MCPLSQILTMFMIVCVQDKYNNIVDEGLEGQVFVTVTCTGDMEVPRFENGDESVTYSLNNGEAHITVSHL